MILTGLDRLLRSPEVLDQRRYGLLSHHAARSFDGQPAHLALQTAGARLPAVLLGPEHGFYGVEQDMVPSPHGGDPLTGLAIVSLYGESASTLRPEADDLADLDLLIIDLVDIGTRYYTYAATALWSAAAALQQGCEVWILDRPNPLGGMSVEGNLPREGFESFVGAFRLPVRHGLTLGELALLEARRRAWPEGLQIWEIEGWRRDMVWSDLARGWTPPSPNLPTAAAAWLYPGICLVEATEISEGRGTTRPFQLVGAPGIRPLDLAEELAGRQLAGVRFVPTYFRPLYQKHRGEICGGVEVNLCDHRRFQPYRCGVELLAALRSVSGEAFSWRRDPYEFESDRSAIDLLTGDDVLRRSLDAGDEPRDWIASWREDEERFLRERNAILLYPETGRGAVSS